MGKGWYIPDENEQAQLTSDDIIELFAHMAEAMANTTVEVFLAEYMPNLTQEAAVAGVIAILSATGLIDSEKLLEITEGPIYASNVEVSMTVDQFISLFTGGIWVGYANSQMLQDKGD